MQTRGRAVSLVLQWMFLAAMPGCAEPDRSFADGSGGAATGSGAAGGPASTATQGQGGSSSTGGGSGGSSTAAGALCGNGTVDAGEECDEATALCDGCILDCPAGWFRAGDSCFAVALGDVTQVDGLTALSRCGALDTLDLDAVGRRAHAATPSTAEQFLALAQACPNNGCWLGYLALGEPTSSELVAPSTGETLFAEAPWASAQPSRGAREVCTRLSLVDDAGNPTASLDDVDCTAGIAYSACELEPSWGSMAACNDGVLDGDEECEGAPGDTSCVDCSRICGDGEVEDPRSHACLAVTTGADSSFAAANDACSLAHAGAALATPDEIADVRVLQLVGTGWLGAQIEAGAASWQSGEAFTYAVGSYPLGGDLGAEGTAAVLGGDGLIGWADPMSARPALCEMFDPG